MLFMRDSWIASLSQFWMKWDDSMTGQKKKKQSTVRMSKQLLLTNDLAELKKLKKKIKEVAGRTPSLPSPPF